ncbi:hypothetical protein ACFXB4_17190 [Streptomyces lavendulae]|uniref:hypothetical protein n=1 Tax=Streptomyces lavendulae TaxID=1914 RepID=UPI0036923F12
MGKSRRNAKAASLALLAVAPLLGGCATHSRQEVLDAVHLRMPDCPAEMHSYAADEAWWPPGWVEMSYTVPKDCMDAYLAAHGVDLTAKPINTWPRSGTSFVGGAPIEPTDPPFSPKTMRRFKLRLDASRTYPEHSFETPYGSRFTVLLDEQGDSTTVYLKTDFGGPHVL